MRRTVPSRDQTARSASAAVISSPMYRAATMAITAACANAEKNQATIPFSAASRMLLGSSAAWYSSTAIGA